MNKKNIGKFLKKLRTEKGLTQTEFSLQFSKFCGIDAYGGFSCAAISKWERGEALPDLYNLRDIARYYGVTMNEILEGCRHISIDYEALYFEEYNRRESERRRSAAVLDINSLRPAERCLANKAFRNEYNADILKIQMHAEDRYRRLIVALAHNNISRTDEDEFDYLCLSYFKQYYCFADEKRTIKPFDVNNLKHIKINIKKLANSLTSCSDEELLFEINRRYCVCNFMPMNSGGACPIAKRFGDIRDVADDLFHLYDLTPIYFDFVESLSPWDKDELLTVALKTVVPNWIGQGDDEDYEFYYSEVYVKEFIKSLIDHGAVVNHAINYKQVPQNRKRYIAQELAEMHQTYCAPTVVYDISQKQYVETKHYSCEYGDPIFTDELKMRYAELEERLFAGENELESCYLIIREKSIYDITYREYMLGRDEQLTKSLYENIDALNVEEIKNRYFIKKESV